MKKLLMMFLILCSGCASTEPILFDPDFEIINGKACLSKEKTKELYEKLRQCNGR